MRDRDRKIDRIREKEEALDVFPSLSGREIDFFGDWKKKKKASRAKSHFLRDSVCLFVCLYICYACLFVSIHLII